MARPAFSILIDQQGVVSAGFVLDARNVAGLERYLLPAK
jgi:hypothetical protein